MKILFVGSEATPFSKTGGLADVLGSLPKELVSLGIDARVVLPKHMWTKEKFNDLLKPVCSYRVKVGPKEEYAGVETCLYEGVRFYFIDNEYYFGYRNTLYGHYDDGERYGYFNNAVLMLLAEVDFYPDIIHTHDWQAGLIPYLYKKKYQYRKHYQGIKTIHTIHNIAYQGRFSKDLMPYLDVEYGTELEFDNLINFMKTALVTADYVTTVSENYAKEILFDYFGYGMQNVLRDREDTLFGIVNGIDYEVFNPKTDPKIAFNYSLYNYLKGKSENKSALREYFGLEDNKRPIIGMVSRLTEAKGFDLVNDIIEDLIYRGDIQFVLLGSGDYGTEEFYNHLQAKYPKQIGVYIGYNADMAQKIYAGSDMFLMPSRFEPCGLAQLISLKYGTVPIIRKTGGLRDTIEIFNKYTGEGTGFGFENYDAGDLRYAINNALEVYGDPKVWKTLIKRGMEQDFSWKESAKKYQNLYQKLREE
jgi:starch synthase